MANGRHRECKTSASDSSKSFLDYAVLLARQIGTWQSSSGLSLIKQPSDVDDDVTVAPPVNRTLIVTTIEASISCDSYSSSSSIRRLQPASITNHRVSVLHSLSIACDLCRRKVSVCRACLCRLYYIIVCLLSRLASRLH